MVGRQAFAVAANATRSTRMAPREAICTRSSWWVVGCQSLTSVVKCVKRTISTVTRCLSTEGVRWRDGGGTSGTIGGVLGPGRGNNTDLRGRDAGYGSSRRAPVGSVTFGQRGRRTECAASTTDKRDGKRRGGTCRVTETTTKLGSTSRATCTLNGYHTARGCADCARRVLRKKNV